MAVLFAPPRYKATDKQNNPISGAFLSFYAADTSTFQPVYADSALSATLTNPVKADANGLFSEIWLDDSLPPYKVIFNFPDINDPTQPGSVIWSIPQYSATVSVTSIAALLNPQSAAELTANVTPTIFIPSLAVDLQRYGGLDNGVFDNSTALQRAINVCLSRGGGKIKVPIVLGSGYRILTAPPTITVPIEFEGDDATTSFFTTPNDITILSFASGGSQSLVEKIGFIGKSGGAVNPGILLTNANNCQLEKVLVKQFGVGVRLTGGGTGNNSSFSNTLRGCRIISNNTINIDGQANTNALLLEGTTFGGGPCATGLKLVDSNTLTILGGDVEGMTLCAIDLDATSTLPAGHVISGLHIEGNSSSAGDIRIGNTAAVNGVTIIAAFYPGTGAIAGINAVNCNGLFVRFTLGSGYTSVPFIQATTLTNEDIAPIGPVTNGQNYRQNNAKFNYADQSVLGFVAATAFDSAYQDSANYNQYRIQSGSVAANKDYYAGLDVIEMTSAGSPGSGAKLYARAMIASNDLGGATKVGAAKMVGDVDISGGQVNISSLSNFANDSAAATGGIAVGGLYRNGSVVQVRVT